MATGTALRAVNMDDPETVDVIDAPVQTTTHIQLIGSEGEVQEYTGTGIEYAVIDGDTVVMGGTITEVESSLGDTLHYHITGLNHDAATIYDYFVTNDNQALLNFYFSGNDRLNGSSSADTINGYSGSDIIKGGGGADKINGGTGADKLYGGTGKDTLIGGSSADKFIFDATPAASHADVITDFSRAQLDKIQLDNADFAIGTSLTSGEFRAATNISANGGATKADHRILYDTDSGKLYYDADGSGTAHDPVLVATLSNKAALVVSDFQVI
jgi:Ca2+-binding RTX toxin-like protein